MCEKYDVIFHRKMPTFNSRGQRSAFNVQRSALSANRSLATMTSESANDQKPRIYSGALLGSAVNLNISTSAPVSASGCNLRPVTYGFGFWSAMHCFGPGLWDHCDRPSGCLMVITFKSLR